MYEFYLIMKLHGETFVTRKITSASRISLNMQQCLYVGNLDAARLVMQRLCRSAMAYYSMKCQMISLSRPESNIRFVNIKHCAGTWYEIRAGGEGLEELAEFQSGQVIVRVDQRYFRPTEVDTLLGDASKAKHKLGWTPKITFEELVNEMVSADLDAAKQELFIRERKK